MVQTASPLGPLADGAELAVRLLRRLHEGRRLLRDQVRGLDLARAAAVGTRAEQNERTLSQKCMCTGGRCEYMGLVLKAFLLEFSESPFSSRLQS